MFLPPASLSDREKERSFVRPTSTDSDALTSLPLLFQSFWNILGLVKDLNPSPVGVEMHCDR